MSLAFIFAGQGAQRVGMGKSLYASSPAARALYDEAKSVLGWDLAQVSFAGPEAALTETKVCQPALYVHGLAVLAALREHRKEELRPAMVLGLSLGELTACATAGVFDFATGLRVVAERGRLMQEACERSTGSMAAIVGEERGTVQALCREFDVEAANFNAPGQVIISGEKARVASAVEAARARGIKKVIPLNVAGAYHSRLMAPARDAFSAFLSGIVFNAPRFTLIANTTGGLVSDPAAIREGLVRQIVSPVLWEDCMRAAAAAGASEFWEFGPGGVLAGLARRTDKAWSVRSYCEFPDVTA
jgi:[acyl-carrier-protein] S-malonyltransferase